MSDVNLAYTYNPDVLNCLANLSSDEVFTPPEIANQMLTCCQKIGTTLKLLFWTQLLKRVSSCGKSPSACWWAWKTKSQTCKSALTIFSISSYSALLLRS